MGIRPFRLPERMQQPAAAAARLPTDEVYFWDAHDDDDKHEQQPLPPVTELNVSFHDFDGLEPQQQQQQDEEESLPQGDSLLSQLDGEHVLQEDLLVRQDEDLAFRQPAPRKPLQQHEEEYDDEEEEVDHVRTMGNIEYFSSASTELQLLESDPTVSQSQEQEDPAAASYDPAASSHDTGDMYNCYNNEEEDRARKNL